MKVANECKNYGIENIFVSGLTINNPLHSDFIRTLNNALKLDCAKYGHNFNKNNTIISDNLWQDGFHLNNSEKCKSLKIFSVSLNKNYFLSKSFIQKI